MGQGRGLEGEGPFQGWCHDSPALQPPVPDRNRAWMGTASEEQQACGASWCVHWEDWQGPGTSGTGERWGTSWAGLEGRKGIFTKGPYWTVPPLCVREPHPSASLSHFSPQKRRQIRQRESEDPFSTSLLGSRASPSAAAWVRRRRPGCKGRQGSRHSRSVGEPREGCSPRSALLAQGASHTAAELLGARRDCRAGRIQNRGPRGMAAPRTPDPPVLQLCQPVLGHGCLSQG